MAGELGKAEANPTKEFFVSTITRDISLEDCILDLIDNSVDAAWQCQGSQPTVLDQDADLTSFVIDLAVGPDLFRIRDNCGGMTLETAQHHAFSFGRKSDDDADEYSIGVYGIGMKRAVFKLGTLIKVRSTYQQDNEDRTSFAVPIDVKDWLTDDAMPWDFEIIEDDELTEDGLEVTVENLTQAAEVAFGSPAFLQNLRRTIGRDYTLHLHRGLTIRLNGQAVAGRPIELLHSDDFAPVRLEYEDEANGEQVLIELIGGMAAPPPDSSEPDDEGVSENRYGWYVACNGRIVLAADQTSVSGWGTDGWPTWHPQYAGFIGIILFTSVDASALPLTTTKRSIDTSSEVFRRARPKMRDITRAWIAYTNARKSSLDEAKVKEAAARPLELQSVQKRAEVALPRVTQQPRELVANVHYAVPLRRMKLLAKALGRSTLPYREVGLRSFDYAFDELVGDE